LKSFTILIQYTSKTLILTKFHEHIVNFIVNVFEYEDEHFFPTSLIVKILRELKCE